MPEHVGLLVEHAPVVLRDDLAGLDVDVRLAREGRAGAGVDAGGALDASETHAEGDLLVVGHRLIWKDQDRIVVEGGPDLGEGRVVQRLPDVHAGDLGTEHRRQGRNRERHGYRSLRCLAGRPSRPTL